MNSDHANSRSARKRRSRSRCTIARLAMTLHAFRTQGLGKTRRVTLDAHLEHMTGGSLQCGDWPLRRNLAPVQDNEVIAGELDVRQQVRRENQRNALRGRDVAHER